MIGNYIMLMTKDEVLRHYLYPIGSERKILMDGMLALHSGYTVEIRPPEREPKRDPGR